MWKCNVIIVAIISILEKKTKIVPQKIMQEFNQIKIFTHSWFQTGPNWFQACQSLRKISHSSITKPNQTQQTKNN